MICVLSDKEVKIYLFVWEYTEYSTVRFVWEYVLSDKEVKMKILFLHSD